MPVPRRNIILHANSVLHRHTQTVEDDERPFSPRHHQQLAHFESHWNLRSSPAPQLGTYFMFLAHFDLAPLIDSNYVLIPSQVLIDPFCNTIPVNLSITFRYSSINNEIFFTWPTTLCLSSKSKFNHHSPDTVKGLSDPSISSVR